MQIGLGISPTQPYGVAVPAFTPASISGLQLWLDASDASTLFTDSAGTTAATADGDPIGCWKDKSGNNKNATQTDGTRKPLLKTSIQNGRSVCRFDSVNDAFSLVSITQQTPSYVYAVVRMNSMTGGYRNLLNRTATSAPYSPALYLSADGNPLVPTIYWGSDNSGNLLYSAALSQAPHIVAFRIDLGSIGITVDSGSEQVRTHSQTVLTSWNTVSAPSSHVLNGDICELLLYNSTINSTQNSTIMNYLNTKWGVY